MNSLYLLCNRRVQIPGSYPSCCIYDFQNIVFPNEFINYLFEPRTYIVQIQMPFISNQGPSKGKIITMIKYMGTMCNVYTQYNVTIK
jgi:hypothetical protein